MSRARSSCKLLHSKSTAVFCGFSETGNVTNWNLFDAPFNGCFFFVGNIINVLPVRYWATNYTFFPRLQTVLFHVFNSGDQKWSLQLSTCHVLILVAI